jgi:catechol 2,3-dioxygenase
MESGEIVEEKDTFVQSGFKIHPNTLPGHVHLTVADLDRQLGFYQHEIGLKLNWRKGSSAGLGVGATDLVRLTMSTSAKRYRGTTGLYHFAILLPNQRELARVIGRLYEKQIQNHPTDHIMTKTTYLDDPEGNNIELYAESPEDGSWSLKGGEYITRRKDGSLSSGREPLDLQALFGKLQPGDKLDQRMPPETRIGHYHLFVANLDESVRFYHEVLGFNDMGTARTIRMAMVSAGDYHHHIGLNTWVGEGAPPPPEGALGLSYISFCLPDHQELDKLVKHVRSLGTAIEQIEGGFETRDPSQNKVFLTTA